jgi:putative hemolysin
MAIAENINLTPLNIKSGHLEVRLAENSIEIDAAQALRYKVFFEEMKAVASENQKKLKRDIDIYDHFFDHILVIDHNISGKIHKKVVGTYRLNRGLKKNKFYTSNEFDISKLIKHRGDILELGRSCVDIDYRNGNTMQMLWRFIAQYVIKYNIDIMFGCASFPGVDYISYKKTFSYMYNKYLAPDHIRPVALDEKYIPLNNNNINCDMTFKEFLTSIPPLIKGYIRLGAFIGDGAVIDREFNTVDICIVLPTSKVSARYMDHYERK